MGLDVWLERRGESIDIPSRQYPDHLFRIGYWRSSYNGAGINHILQDRINTDLYEIGCNLNADFETKPDWKQVKKNAIKAREDLGKWFLENGSFGVFNVSPINIFSGVKEDITTEADALKIFTEMNSKYNKDSDDAFGGSFANGFGTFSLDEPFKVRGFIPGVDIFKQPTIYVVYDTDPTIVETYFQSLEIVEETADYVLEQDDLEQYTLCWSG